MKIMEDETTIKGLGRAGFATAPFDRVLAELKRQKGRIGTLRDFAYARIKTGYDNALSRKGAYVGETFVYSPDFKAVLVRRELSPIIKDAKTATDCHRNRREFYIDSKPFLETAEEDKKLSPEKRRAIIISSEKHFTIPTKDFGNREETLWAFQDQAQPYGDYLRGFDIEEMLVYMVNSNVEKPFARPAWLHMRGFDFGYGSGLSDYYRDLYYDCEVFGVREASANSKGANDARKILPYSQREVDKYLGLVREIRAGNVPASKLEKVAKFLSKLKK